MGVTGAKPRSARSAPMVRLVRLVRLVDSTKGKMATLDPARRASVASEADRLQTEYLTNVAPVQSPRFFRPLASMQRRR